MGLSEEVLPHRSFHALAPCSQLRPAFEDVTAGTDGLQERELTGGGRCPGKQKAAPGLGIPWVDFPAPATRGNTRKLLNIPVEWGFRPLFTDEDPEAQRGHDPPRAPSQKEQCELVHGLPPRVPHCSAAPLPHSTHMHQLCDGHQVRH